MNLTINPTNTNQSFKGSFSKKAVKSLFKEKNTLLLNESGLIRHKKKPNLLKTFLVTAVFGLAGSTAVVANLGNEQPFWKVSEWKWDNFDMDAIPLVLSGLLPAGLVTGLRVNDIKLPKVGHRKHKKTHVEDEIVNYDTTKAHKVHHKHKKSKTLSCEDEFSRNQKNMKG